MKIITWNCQGAFRKKAGNILVHRPDIVVIQECEHPEKLIFSKVKEIPKDQLWFGENLHKGLGIFSYSDFRFKLLDQYDRKLKIVVPILVSDEQFSFILLAIWANNADDPDGKYVEQVWKAIHHYEDLLGSEHVILIGDFNSNTIWDKPKRIGNHSAVVQKLAKNKISSVYHHYFKQEHGKEKHPTFYLYRDRSKPYHLDYCFLSEKLNDKVKNFQVGTYRKWKEHSDHVPLIVEFDF